MSFSYSLLQQGVGHNQANLLLGVTNTVWRRNLSQRLFPLRLSTLTLMGPDSLVLSSTNRTLAAASFFAVCLSAESRQESVHRSLLCAPAFNTVRRKDRRLSSIHIGYRPYRNAGHDSCLRHDYCGLSELGSAALNRGTGMHSNMTSRAEAKRANDCLRERQWGC